MIIAEKRNVAVATIDRIESRPIPHMPCPLVQPEPSLVPNPTSKPAIMTVMNDFDCNPSLSRLKSISFEKSIPEVIIPERKANLQRLSFFGRASNDPIMPDMPAILPNIIIIKIEARPIVIPPNVLSTGVNCA